jgi:hypothetical protein
LISCKKMYIAHRTSTANLHTIQQKYANYICNLFNLVFQRLTVTCSFPYSLPQNSSPVPIVLNYF